MISQDTLVNHYDKLNRVLSSLLTSSRIHSELVSNTKFRSVFEDVLDIFYYLCNKTDRINDFNNIKDQYLKISKSSYNPKVSLSFTDKHDLQDQVNYFYIYLMNTYQIDADNVQLTDIKDNVDCKDHCIKPENNPYLDQVDNNAKKAQDAFFNTFSDQPSASSSFTKEAFFEQASYLKLREQIMRGKFYVYDSKPKEILYIKYILYFLYMILTGLFGALTLMVFIQASLPNPPKNSDLANWYKDLWPSWFTSNLKGNNNSSISSSSSSGDSSTSNVGIFAYNYTQLSIGLIFVFFYCIMLSYKYYKLLFIVKNDNYLYYLEKRSFIFLAIFCVFYLMSSTSLNNPLEILKTTQIASNQSNNNKSFYFGMFIVSAIVYCFIGLILSLFVCALFFNPKKDPVRISKKLDEYKQEIMNSQF